MMPSDVFPPPAWKQFSLSAMASPALEVNAKHFLGSVTRTMHTETCRETGQLKSVKDKAENRG